jgi:hypothetical protein
MQDTETREPFIRFDNHVSLGHIFTTIVMLIGGVSWVVATEGRISNLEKEDVKIERAIQESRTDVRSLFVDIKQDLREINAKLDRKADK